MLDVIAGYDPNDPVTAYSVGEVPRTYTAALNTSALRGARMGVLRLTTHAAAREPLRHDARESYAGHHGPDDAHRG